MDYKFERNLTKRKLAELVENKVDYKMNEPVNSRGGHSVEKKVNPQKLTSEFRQQKVKEGLILLFWIAVSIFSSLIVGSVYFVWKLKFALFMTMFSLVALLFWLIMFVLWIHQLKQVKNRLK